MRQQVAASHLAIEKSPEPYQEILANAFSQIDATLEELEVAEQELRQQNDALVETRQTVEYERQRYRELFEFAPNVYFVTDRDGLILEANQAAAILLNVDIRRLIRKPIANFVEAQERAVFRRDLLSLRYIPRLPEWEFTLQPRSSEPFVVAATVARRTDSSGSDSLWWTLTDITQRKHTERQILALNAALEARVADRTRELEAAFRRERHATQMLTRRLLQEVAEDAYSGVGLCTFYVAASEEALIGGDFFDSFSLQDGRVAFVVGDVSGKGLLAASHTAETKYMLRAFLRQTGSPSEALFSVNNALLHAQSQYLDESDGIFVALSLALMTPSTGETVFVSAGAERPLLQRADGAIVTVETHNLPLGVVPDASYETAAHVLGVRDRIYLFTDGLTEARRGNEMLGQAGLHDLVRDSYGATLANSGAEIMQAAQAFSGGSLQDDACLLIAERR